MLLNEIMKDPKINQKMNGMKNGLHIDKEGNKAYYLDDELHREDGPALEFVNGSRAWFLNGKRHRVGGPAVEMADGTKEWWVNGKLHNENGPAVIYASGRKEWYLDGVQSSNVIGAPSKK